MVVKAGDRFYSEYFQTYGTVTRYFDDNNWWFRLDGQHCELRARSTPDKLKWV